MIVRKVTAIAVLAALAACAERTKSQPATFAIGLRPCVI